MKFTYTFTVLAIFFSIASFAQITIDSSDFASVGDTFTVATTTNPSSISVIGGANHTWDFSSLKADSLIGSKARAINPTLYPQDTLFRNSDMQITTPAFGDAYFVKTADSLSLDGVAQMQLIQGAGVDFNFEPNLAIVHFPLNYLDQFTSRTKIDTTIDTSIAALNFDSLRLEAIMDVKSEVEGWGKVNTPQGTKNALKLYSREAQRFTVKGHIKGIGWSPVPIITQEDTLHMYRWLAKDMEYVMVEAEADEKNGTVTDVRFIISDSLFAYFNDEIEPDCYGKSTGELNVKASGGTGTYTYKWSHNPPSQTNKATNLSAGNYTVTVTDPITTNSIVISTELKEPDSLSIHLISTKDEGPAPNTGEIEIGVSGGTHPYTYKWNNSASTTKKASDLAGGTHTVTVIDDNLCQKDTSIDIGSTVGLENVVSENTIWFGPNPASNTVNFGNLSSKGCTITLLNISGKTVFTTSTNNEHVQINISHFPKGKYFVSIETEEGNQLMELIVQ